MSYLHRFHYCICSAVCSKIRQKLMLRNNNQPFRCSWNNFKHYSRFARLLKINFTFSSFKCVGRIFWLLFRKFIAFNFPRFLGTNLLSNWYKICAVNLFFQISRCVNTLHCFNQLPNTRSIFTEQKPWDTRLGTVSYFIINYYCTRHVFRLLHCQLKSEVKHVFYTRIIDKLLKHSTENFILCFLQYKNFHWFFNAKLFYEIIIYLH